MRDWKIGILRGKIENCFVMICPTKDRNIDKIAI